MGVLFFIFPAFEKGSCDAAWQNPLWNQQRWHVLPEAERENSQVGCEHSPHYNSIMYAKLCLYEGSINGWGRCNCLKQGISLSLMSRGSVMGLFTLLWWQGAGVIRNTNPLINFWNGGSLWSKGVDCGERCLEQCLCHLQPHRICNVNLATLWSWKLKSFTSLCHRRVSWLAERVN